MELIKKFFKVCEKNPLSAYISNLIKENINSNKRVYTKHKFIDMHTHTNHSDGVWSAFDVMLNAAEKGLDGCAITDHNSFENYNEIKKAAGKIKKLYPEFIVIPGTEISVREGHVGVYYDKIKLNTIKKLVKARRIADLMKEINKINLKHKGEVIAVPFHYWRAWSFCKEGGKLIERIKDFKNFYALEAVNGDHLVNKTETARELGVSPIAGSDAHSIFRVGNVFTVYDKNIRNVSDVFKALKNRKTKISNSYYSNFQKKLITYSYLLEFLNPVYLIWFIYKIPQILNR